MKPDTTRTLTPFRSRTSLALAGSIAALLVGLAASANAAPFVWDGTNNTWTSPHWNAGVSGPTGASNADSATINGGTVTFAGNDTFGNVSTPASPVITINSGATLASGGFFNTMWDLTLNGGTLLANGGVNDPYGAFKLSGTVTVGGSVASNISVGAGANNTVTLGADDGGFTTFNVADVTGSSATDLTISTVLSTIGSPSGLIKEGAGTLTLTAANNYTGATTVNAGTLELAFTGNTAVGTLAVGSNITVNSGGTLLANAFNALGYGFHDGDTLLVNEGGTLKVGAGQVVSTVYALNVVGGSLTSADAGYPGLGTFYFNGNGTQTFTSSAGGTASLISAQNVNLAANVTFTVNDGPGAVDLSVTGNLIGNSGLQKNGAGTMVLSGANTYTGTTTVNGGVLSLATGLIYSNSGFADRQITINGGATVAVGGWGDTATAGLGQVSFISSNIVLNNGTIRYTGGYDGGNLDRGFTIGASGATLDAAGGVNTFILNQGRNFGVTSNASGTLTLTGSSNGVLNLNLGGAGALVKSGAGVWVVSGTNTYTGVTTLAGGVLNVASVSDYGVAGGLGNRSAAQDAGGDIGILFRGGTLQYTGSTAQSTNRAIRINADGGGGNAGGATIDASGSNPAATLSFTATSSPNFFEFPGTRTLTLTGSNTGANTFAMAIGEAGDATSVVKSGVGQWVLSGANTYTGTTTVNGGTLNVTGSIASSGSISIAAGATLNAAGYNTLPNGNWTIAGTLNKTDGAIQDIVNPVTLNNGTISGATDNSDWGTFNLFGSTTITANGSANTINAARLGMSNSVVFTTPNAVDALTVSSILGATNSAGGSLTKTGNGMLTLSGANTYTGGTTLNGGTLQINNATALSSGTLTLASGTQFTLNTSGITANAIYLSGAGTQTIFVGLANKGGLTTTTPTLTGNISTDGSAGTLSILSAGRESGTNNLTFSGNTITLGNKSLAIYGASVGNVDSDPEAQAQRLTLNNATLTTNGDISVGRGALQVQGSSSVTIGGQIRSSNAWNDFRLGGTSSVVVTGGVDFRNVASHLSLDGGTLTTPFIWGNFTFGGQTRTILNGTRVIASADSADFLKVSLDFDGLAHSAAAEIANGGAIFDTNGHNVTIANALADLPGQNGGLTKLGNGVMVLSGANTYSGATAVSAGTLRFTDTAPNSSASLSIASGATLEFNVSTAPTPFDGANVQLGAVGGTTVTGTGTFVKSGAGVLALDGQGGNHAVTFNMTGGLIDIQGGTLRNGGWDGGIWGGNLASMNVATGAMFDFWGGQSVVVDALTGGGTIDATLYGGGQTLTVGANNGSGTFSGVFQNTTGSLGLIKTGSGTQILSGANTYSGGTTVSGGILEATSNNALGTNAAGTSVTAGAALKLTGVNYTTAEALSINGTGISGGGALVNSGTSSFAGAVTAATNATINAGGGNLSFTGGLVKNGTTLTLTGGGTINVGTVGISGASSGSDLIVDGVTVNENVANDYNGPTFILSTSGAGTGILNATVANALPTANGRTAVTMDASGLGSSQLNLTAGQSIASLTGAASSLVSLGGNSLTIGTTSGTTTFAGVISGASGNLIKDGASTQVLTGANLYTGATTVSGGTLALGSTGALTATTSVAVNSGGTLLLGASNQINDSAGLTLNGGTLNTGGFSETLGALTLSDNSIIDFGSGSSTLGFADSTGLWTVNKRLSIWNWSGNTLTGGGTDQLLFASNGLDATQLSHIDFYSDAGVNKISLTPSFGANGFVSFGEVVPVPEPTSFGVAMGLLGLIGWRERRKARQARIAQRRESGLAFAH